MRNLIRWLIVVPLFLLVATPVLAQGRLIFEDETGNLNRQEIEAAARPLLNRGADVAVYMTQSGGEEDFLQRLEQDGLVRDDQARTNMIALYVALDERHSSIRFGEQWNAALAINDNFQTIRQTELNPGLAAGNYTEGFANALRAIDSAIASPPQPGGGTNINFNFLPVIIAVFVLLGLIVGWRVFSRRRAAAQALNDARERAEQARRAAGGAIADMGRALRTTQEKAQFDRVSYAPADVEALAQAQRELERRFVDAQHRFDDIGEKLEQQQQPTIEQYDAATQGYTEVQQLVTGDLEQRLAAISAQRAELDRLAQQAPGTIDDAKKNMSEVVDQLAALQADIPDADAVLAPLNQQIAQAEQALADHDARSAIASAQAATDAATTLAALLTNYADVRAGIVRGHNDAEALAAAGYRMETSNAALEEAQQALSDTAQALQRAQVAAAEASLQQAQQQLAEAVANGRGLQELQAENERRLADIEVQGQEVARIIEAGHQTFDLVDEFAESTWSDIRGNGSEAQSAADRAHEHWLNARHNNTMDVQDFVAARDNLDAAAEELGYARSLIDAITQRLHDLETARDTARAEISAAVEDIQRGWEFVHAHDPDVGKQPEQDLQQAEQLLNQAQAEIRKEKPDWLELVRQAQAANDLADQALAGARSEVEAMEKLRSRAERAQQLASAEVQKIVKFAGLHSQDIQPENGSAIERIQQQVQQAYATLQRAEQVEEEQRSATLQRAYELYTHLQTDAEQVYAAVYADFQRLEQMRVEVNRELSAARSALVSAESTLSAYRHSMPHDSTPERTIRSARRRFDKIRLPISGEDNLRDTVQLARDITRDAREAEEDIRRNYRRRHDHDRGGDILTGMVIGSLLDSATRDRDGGWGSSGSWSSGGGGGGGGWGALGGGGGSWGGGGGGGGSWGGGGGGGGW